MALTKRSFSLSGHRTSVALEAEFWAVLEIQAKNRALSMAAYVAHIDAARAERPLASALRLAALAATEGRRLLTQGWQHAVSRLSSLERRIAP